MALHERLRFGASLKKLEKDGCPIDHATVDWKGRNLLFYVRQVEDVTTLVKNGVDLEQRSSSGKTPLLHALRKGRYQSFVLAMIDLGAKTDVVDNHGNNIWHYTALLIELGDEFCQRLTSLAVPGINSTNKQGLTPLALAASLDHRTTTRKLVGCGAKIPLLLDDKHPISLATAYSGSFTLSFLVRKWRALKKADEELPVLASSVTDIYPGGPEAFIRALKEKATQQKIPFSARDEQDFLGFYKSLSGASLKCFCGCDVLHTCNPVLSAIRVSSVKIVEPASSLPPPPVAASSVPPEVASSSLPETLPPPVPEAYPGGLEGFIQRIEKLAGMENTPLDPEQKAGIATFYRAFSLVAATSGFPTHITVEKAASSSDATVAPSPAIRSFRLVDTCNNPDCPAHGSPASACFAVPKDDDPATLQFSFPGRNFYLCKKMKKGFVVHHEDGKITQVKSNFNICRECVDFLLKHNVRPAGSKKAGWSHVGSGHCGCAVTPGNFNFSHGENEVLSIRKEFCEACINDVFAKANQVPVSAEPTPAPVHAPACFATPKDDDPATLLAVFLGMTGYRCKKTDKIFNVHHEDGKMITRVTTLTGHICRECVDFLVKHNVRPKDAPTSGYRPVGGKGCTCSKWVFGYDATGNFISANRPEFCESCINDLFATANKPYPPKGL
jgi:hypothetical protein